MKNMAWAMVEINKINKIYKEVNFPKSNKMTIWALAHRLAKANREISKLKKKISKLEGNKF